MGGPERPSGSTPSPYARTCGMPRRHGMRCAARRYRLVVVQHGQCTNSTLTSPLFRLHNPFKYLTYHGIHDAQGTGIRRARRARSALRLSRRLVELLDSTMAPRIWNARGVPVSRAAARWVLHTHEELVVSSGARVPGEALRGSSSFTEEDAPPPAALGSSLRGSPCGAARAASAWEGVSTGTSSAGSERAARLALSASTWRYASIHARSSIFLLTSLPPPPSPSILF